MHLIFQYLHKPLISGHFLYIVDLPMAFSRDAHARLNRFKNAIASIHTHFQLFNISDYIETIVCSQLIATIAMQSLLKSPCVTVIPCALKYKHFEGWISIDRMIKVLFVQYNLSFAI